MSVAPSSIKGGDELHRAVLRARAATDAIAAARSRMIGGMRTINDFGGPAAVRQVFEAEFARLVAPKDAGWVG